MNLDWRLKSQRPRQRKDEAKHAILKYVSERGC
jgi:hypothetical protein